MQTLSQHAMVYLEDGTPMLEEVLMGGATWSGRTSEEKEALTRLLHDYDVGEDWDQEDSWADVSFTAEEIRSFSAHVLVPGDNGLPEWYAPVSLSDSSTLKSIDHDTQSQ